MSTKKLLSLECLSPLSHHLLLGDVGWQSEEKPEHRSGDHDGGPPGQS